MHQHAGATFIQATARHFSSKAHPSRGRTTPTATTLHGFESASIPTTIYHPARARVPTHPSINPYLLYRTIENRFSRCTKHLGAGEPPQGMHGLSTSNPRWKTAEVPGDVSMKVILKTQLVPNMPNHRRNAPDESSACMLQMQSGWAASRR